MRPKPCTRAARPAPTFLTITLNPAIDRTIEVDALRLGEVVRGRLTYVEPAGKGVNVAHTLAALGHKVVCTGFVGRDEAAMFDRGFAGATVRPAWVRVDGLTRTSITLLDLNRTQETHITEQGFTVSRRHVRRLCDQVCSHLRPGVWVLANGRPAPGFGVEPYRDLLRRIKASGARLAVDTSGEYLRAAVEIGPDVVKPNDEELSELVGRPLRRMPSILLAAREIAASIRHVVVSLGARGVVCVTRQRSWHARERGRPRVVHTVGCGDALTAGFVAGVAEGLSAPKALRLSVACGGACVRTPRASLRAKDEAQAVLPLVTVRRA